MLACMDPSEATFSKILEQTATEEDTSMTERNGCLESSEVTEHNGPQFRDVVNQVNAFRSQSANDVHDAGDAAVAATTAAAVQGVGTTVDVGYRGVNATTTAAAAGAMASCKTDERIADAYRALTLQVCKAEDGVKDSLNVGFTAAQVAMVTGFKDMLIESKVAQGLAYQIEGRTALTACQNQSATMLAFKDQALLSQSLAAQAAKEAAECCCELKALINSDGNATRALLNSQETDRLRDRAQRAENAINAFYAAKLAPVAPVGGPV